MNYRHAFHAGNFADVVKHAVLTRIILALREKERPFRVLDTHAGAGAYDLAGPEASRTGEWREGIGRLMTAALDQPVRDLLAPYLDAVAMLNGGEGLRLYPGSPLLVRALLRRDDRLVACEREPGASAALARALRGDARAKAVEIDGWMALNAYLPPRERRGLVLIDPPYEDPDEFARLADAFAGAHRKWPTGIYLMWYPIKDRAGPDLLARRLQRSNIGKILRAELELSDGNAPARLAGCGLVIVNPPWRLTSELQAMLPALASVLGEEGRGRAAVTWLAGER
ncbi:MAG TPA: 23S rRNA (adenine(2030)-N(6))-methyltransferase RlmJ [Xanthobacteraceae bacterium]|nr:23S rRNA (adenine(2030)-N(6))-methyltransferase RlmJ [Xanthobacteraceae bacterium]